ncbi:fumarylacetoacetate hydrolase family protein [Marinobacter nanhaiticus D15-8W]|uniref:Fumarylacetoacetate hydrolase family protein n=1 Tax=Marinobacter nanhaiticus D15-8W TaxID=626887 RepID=N6WQF0_9GAMM|nr:fumarylacetoacetate hydrolase family protein [Marinobacter nanhaiticus]ENO13262.1 fumarylacetoacetate hydrolase family protein [Marinobacter nanhaiticus D15-8W]BES70626.1 fumarylacetoacetate hydrolase family protein [Marinobacter nanhaiticus D15-8W]
MHGYQHFWHTGNPIELPLGKIVCVGRNYAAHARELDNPVPDTPLLFMKPATAAKVMEEPIRLPQGRGEVHFETELAILIDKPLTDAYEDEVREAIIGYGLALDLTLRDVQSQLKADGHPWERAKAFDGACPLSPFVPAKAIHLDEAITFALDIDDHRQQNGSSWDMLLPIVPLIAHISEHFTLTPGDVILTGTPEGVGALVPGQKLSLQLNEQLLIETRVI